MVFLHSSTRYAIIVCMPSGIYKRTVHHILGFKEHPELRYDINNGITLCHFHHPRKKEEEKRLIPTFMELVSVSKEII